MISGINFEIFRDKIGVYKHFLGEFPDRFFWPFFGILVSTILDKIKWNSKPPSPPPNQG